MVKAKKNLTTASHTDAVKKVKKKKRVKKRTKVNVTPAPEDASSESEVSSASTLSKVPNAAPTAENIAIAIPEPQRRQNPRTSNPSLLNHVMLLVVNSWRAQSICSRISAFILPFICMLLLFGWTFLFIDNDDSDDPNSNQTTASRSDNPHADLFSHASIKALHVYPDTNFTRKFTQEMLKVWDSGRETEGKPIELIFCSTIEALMNKLNQADIKLAIKLPNDWDGARPFDYKIIPSPRINLPNEKESVDACRNDKKTCSSPSQTYLKSGLLAVQSVVDFTVLQWTGLLEQGAKLTIDRFHVKFRQMEGRRFYKYSSDSTDLIYLMAAILAMAPFIELSYKLLVLVVHEKLGVKNVLKMMGLSEIAYWLSKLVYFGALIVYYAIVITACLKVLLFKMAYTGLFFVLLLLFGISCLPVAYLLTAFFTSPKYTFIAYIFMYAIVISRSVASISLSRRIDIDLNETPKQLFIVNLIAALASLHASMIPDSIYDKTGVNLDQKSRQMNDKTVYIGVIFFLVDSILYFLLGFYLNNVIPDQFGIRQSPTFLFSPSYWGCSGDSKKVKSEATAGSSTTITDENFEPVPPGMFGAPAISIRNLRKNYTLCPWRKTNPDVLKGISLDIYAGQVTAILGKNGAGKSTLFHILIGLIPPSAGTANIFGYNSSNQVDVVKIRRLVGVCLQHDVHFDFLTVLQHMQFYGKLRGFQGAQLDREVSQLIKDLNLEEVKGYRANKLSGGQKRRLSVGLAFIGDPPIIFLDEPSAGLDPVARRGLWSLLQSRREGKVILLTTHFMDEADILADRKAIMNSGIVRCMGSSLFLKNRFGTGYQLTVALTSASVDTTATDQIIAEFSPDAASSRKQVAHELKYALPFSEAPKFPSMFAQLELEMEKSIRNLGIATTSLEDVFLKVCSDEVVSEVEKSKTEEQVDLLGNLGVLKIAFFSSLWAMVVIRLRRVFRSPCYFILLFVIPFIITLLYLNLNFPTVVPNPQMGPQSSLRVSDRKGIYKDGKVAVYENGVGIAQFLQNEGISVKTYAGGPEDWRKLADRDEYMAALSVEMSRTPDPEGFTVDVWLNERLPHAAPILLDLLFKFYAQSVGGKRSMETVQVNTEYDYMRRKQKDRQRALTSEENLAVVIPIVLGLTYSAPLVELVYENEKQLRNHLRVNGLSPLIYYLSFFVVYFGLTFTLWLFLFAATCIFNVASLTNVYAFPILSGLITLSIIESILLMILLSLLIRKTTIAHAVFFPLYLVMVCAPTVMFRLRPDRKVPILATFALDTFYIPVGFYNGLLVVWNEDLYEPLVFSSYNNYYVVGPAIIMSVHIVVYLGLLVLKTYGSRLSFSSPSRAPVQPLDVEQADDDVVTQSQRIAEIFPAVGKNSDCVLIAKELRKSYGKRQILHGLSLLVEKGQVLGLLGHNGAGKTTTMRIITAEEPADSGQVKVGGYNIPGQSDVAFRELGFCPQHDALWDNIRVSEHINLYSVIHGVSGSRRNQLAVRIHDGLSIREHERKYSQNLSGGTKRKLGYGMAMASAPQIVLMDEPSTGMDPQSKRFLWNTVLGSFKENRGAILTTHAMEEADVLSSKIAIMAKGALLCVGSPQHLKSKFGRSYTLEIKLESFVKAGSSVEGVQSPVPSQFEFVFQHFPNCNLVEQFGNRAVFSIPVENLRPLSETFGLIEKLKVSHGVQEYAYTQTTLEQVYLTIDQAAQKNLLQ